MLSDKKLKTELSIALNKEKHVNHTYFWWKEKRSVWKGDIFRRRKHSGVQR